MSDIEEDRYHDIRPYNDEEVRQVLERLGQSFELHRALVSYRFKRYPQWSQRLLTNMVGWQLRRHFAPMTTVDAFQGWLKDWITALIESTTSDVEIHGLEHLEQARSYLWLSNHRDIAMDPTLVGYALVASGWPTARIAIGDNLLSNPVLADLMRLNKSFIVKRSITDRRTRLKEFQKLSGYIRHSLEEGHSVWLALIESTTSDVEIHGLEHLEQARSYLWLSNHRDIAMDPTLVGYALVASGWPTARIAIGDNLLSNPVLADLMRLNKSFIVKRSITDRRTRLKEFQKLSGYIRHSLEEGHSVWLAQREGRAKDNLDHTDTAVLKMLSLSGRDDRLSFPEVMERLRPVPVLVQYEWDPCDVLKARELVALEEKGYYEKAEGEDTHSILLGMKGQKGKIRICFGMPLTMDEMQDATRMATATDSAIDQMKTLFPVNYAALRILQDDYQLYQNLNWQCPEDRVLPVEALKARCSEEPVAVRIRLLKTYAASLISRSGLIQE